MRNHTTPPGAVREVSAAELHAMSSAERHELGAQIARELLADSAPASSHRPRQLAEAMLDLAAEIRPEAA